MPYLNEINTLRRERLSAFESMKEIRARNKEKVFQDWSQEDQTNFQKAETDIDTKGDELRMYEKLDGYESTLTPRSKESIYMPNAGQNGGTDPEDDEDGNEVRKLKEGEDRVRGVIVSAQEYRSMARAHLRRKRLNDLQRRAAMQAENDFTGGLLVASEVMATGLLKKVDDYVFLRQLAYKLSVGKAQSLGVLYLESDPTDPDFTPEIGATQFDDGITLSKRNLHPHMQTKGIKLSNTLVRNASMDIEQIVFDRFAQKWATNEENLFLNGTGVGQPLGIMTPSVDGIPSSRQVAINTTTTLDIDKMIDAYHNQKPQYLPRCVWSFSREILKRIRKAKASGSGDYLWQPSIQLGVPDTILGRPYFVSEFHDSTFSAGHLVGFFGDLSFYYIADALDFELVVLDQPYQVNNQIGYLMRRAFDAQPVMSEAFTILSVT